MNEIFDGCLAGRTDPHQCDCAAVPETITADQLAEMTTTELFSLLATIRLTIPQIRAIRAEIDSRRI